ncbi:SWIM zinc finger family protein [Actinoplanes xinjiangensis]|uniref:SWIM zinc finger family protein n=1 Tax=Actinoplanes xinjiangensis TaxID=512350 RepID=UPI00343D93E5
MPVERWSAAQVEALAPDPASLRNARAAAGQFTATGLTGDILWGLCRGYQVAADLAGPAYKCSCPSRKIPCKHVLGLLLRWSTSGVSSGSGSADPIPGSIATWQAARAARAARSPVSAPDPVAAARRAQSRADRVAGGMAELRRWLDDQIGQGLAAAGRAGPQPFETMAARLVDAQAPGVANTVRRLGGFAGVGPQWADRLLGELALLRLLVAGHSRLDMLDPALAATVRSRVGFPTPTEEVLAGPRVTDRWQVLGQVETDDGSLTSRRTWLHGAGGRFALVLTFAAPGRPLPADLIPGTEFRGDLCFHPGAAPLRAIIAERVSAAEPFGSPDGAGTIRAALSRWASLLAADPWRSDAPMLLSSMRPTSDGHLIDAEGSALPLAPGHRSPWWLLAAAGAAPATVAAEWSPAGLRPLAAWVDGLFVPAVPQAPDPSSRRAAELPPELLTAALVGTGRRPWSVSSVQVGALTVDLASAVTRTAGSSLPVTPATHTEESSPAGSGGSAGPAGGSAVGEAGAAAALLEAAAVALTCRRAGVEPEIGRLPQAPAPAESDALLPPAAAVRLARILGGGAPGGGHHEQELLAQWLTAAAARGGIVPPVILPDLLEAGRRNTSVRADVARVAGRRGAWLAGQRADWRWLLNEAAPTLTGDWTTATTAERLGHLTALRATDPGRARELLESTWAEESSENRTRFLATFGPGLSTADEPLLERALDDRRKEVREAALDLLRHLPGAALGRRMATRARKAVRLDGSGRLIVEPPTELDHDLRRDGVGATPVRGIGIGAWLLEEVVAGTPLATWTPGAQPGTRARPATTAGVDPTEPGEDRPGTLTSRDRDPVWWLAAARGHDWAVPLLHGWAKAAVVQGDARWASALLTADGGALREAVRWDLHLVLPPEVLARLATTALRSEDGSAQRLLGLHPGPWPDSLAVAVLETVEQRARTDRHTWQLGELCRAAGLAMPPGYADLAGRLAARLDQIVDPARVRPVAELARTLTFRHEMLQELQ